MKFAPNPRRPRWPFRLLLAAPAFASFAAPTPMSPYVVEGRATDLLGTALSASQGIVGAVELEARPFLRRGELLEVVPGVVITQHSGDGKANQYFLRGFNLDHGTDLAIEVDGVPANLRSHAHGQGYADVNFVIPELVRQVDFSKGPFFAEVGDFSAAGAIGFRQYDRLPHGFATLSAGQDRYARFAAGATRVEGAAAVTGAFEFTHDDGPWLLRESSNRFNGFARLHGRTSSADYRVTAQAYRASWRSTDQIPQRAVAAGALPRFGAIDGTDGGDSDRFSLAFDARVRGADAATQFSAYALRYRLNLYSNFTYFLDDPAEGDQFNQRDGRSVLGGSLVRTWMPGGGSGTRVITAGVQLRGDFIDELGLHRTAARRRLRTVRDDAVEELSGGAFVQHHARWTDWLRTTAGVRADGFHFDVDGDDPRNSGANRAALVSPKFSLAFGPWARTEAYISAGTGFHSNDARGTTIRIDPADGVTPVERVTPLARSRGAEAGWRTTLAPGLVSSLAVWLLELDSELVFVGDSGGTEPAGRTRRYGVEWANFWRPRPGVAFDADVALTRARYRDDAGAGRMIANSIATVVTAGLALGEKEGGFGGVRLRYFGPQPLNEDNSVRAPSSLTFHARAGWRLRGWEVSLELLNALNRENNDIAYAYVSRLRGEPAGGIDDVHFHPAEPRTWRVAVRREF